MANFIVTPYGVQLPEGQTFPEHGHVNIKITTLDGEYIRDAGIHFDPNNSHPGAEFIGQSFYPITLGDGECISWTQVHGWDYHFGENGEAPICLPVDEEEEPVIEEPEAPVREVPEPVESPTPSAPTFQPDECGEPIAQTFVNHTEGVSYYWDYDGAEMLLGPGAYQGAGSTPEMTVLNVPDDLLKTSKEWDHTIVARDESGAELGRWQEVYAYAGDECETNPEPVEPPHPGTDCSVVLDWRECSPYPEEVVNEIPTERNYGTEPPYDVHLGDLGTAPGETVTSTGVTVDPTPELATTGGADVTAIIALAVVAALAGAVVSLLQGRKGGRNA